MKNKHGLSDTVATILIIILTLIAIGIIWVVINNIVNGGKQIEENTSYNNCLQIFANAYCHSINYTDATFRTIGFENNQYFKCGSERDYLGYGEFVNIQSEKDYCKSLSEGTL
jgi:hypothetical protein